MRHHASARARQLLGFLACLLLCFATSGVGALATVNAKAFYATLIRPEWAPPGWVFAPVWSTLFLAMAISVWLVWRIPGSSRARRIALGLFGLQLAANALWSWLFFAWNLGALAFAEVLLLWLLIAATLLSFWRLQVLAGWLLVPYLAWVSFASALSFTFWRLNPGILG